jgi:serine/threonine-protein kinase
LRRILPAKWLAAMHTAAMSRAEPPGELIRESRRRVRVAAAIGVAGYLIVLGAASSGVLHATPLERAVDVAHDWVGLAACTLLLGATLLRRLADRAVFALALSCELLLAAVISLTIPWAMFLRTGHLVGLTWVVPIMILFPLLVPARPRTVLLVSAACALMMPGGIAVLAAAGRVVAHRPDYLAAAITGTIGAGIAVVASRTVYGARQQLAVASRMGSYELIERLGQGGMGEVWRAHHSMLARPAAVKLILPERLQAPAEARETAVQRFTREAQLTAGLRSPHTVQLFDFGISADGVMYYAMELLDGLNLDHFVYRYGPVEPRRAVHWLRQACHSLGEAHARDLTHRDIKPANLFVCAYGRERDFVKVLDFGLARPAVAAGDARLTREGGWLGTPGYMAPEQVFGRDSGPSADLYALGCVAYWLLSGEKPFEADDAGELMRQHVQVAAAPLGERAKQPIPPALEAVVMACLAKEPASRPRDADELSERLARAVDGEPWSSAEALAWWAGKPSGP